MSRERFAALLIQARISGKRIASLDPDFVPRDAEAAYDLQDFIIAKLGVRVAGWKVGAASPISRPSCAPIFAGHVVQSPAHLLAPQNGLNGVEAELAFRMARDLPARSEPYGEDEVWDAIASMHPAVEYLDTRFATLQGTPEYAILADNISNGGFCWGPAIENWQSVDPTQAEARLIVDGQDIARAVGGNAAGHPKRLLAWLANHAAGRNRPLKAGDFVTTGSHTGLHTAPLRVPVIARFVGLGESQLTLVG